jgi:hypothetical protein
LPAREELELDPSGGLRFARSVFRPTRTELRVERRTLAREPARRSQLTLPSSQARGPKKQRRIGRGALNDVVERQRQRVRGGGSWTETECDEHDHPSHEANLLF